VKGELGERGERGAKRKKMRGLLGGKTEKITLREWEGNIPTPSNRIVERHSRDQGLY